jgi:branched-chain amino acid transport system ATP-binding protein
MLSLKNLSVNHGPLTALWDVSLDVRRGEKVGLLGANGAGKSTTMGAIVGLYPRASGTITYDGQVLERPSTAQTVAGGIALVPEGRRLFAAMSVLENLEMGVYAAANRKDMAAALARVYELFPILREKAAQNAGELSGGQQQMVAIGRALMSCPRLLLLDEPFIGVAPKLIDEILSALHSIAAEGVTMILVEQKLDIALPFTSRTHVMIKGQLAWVQDSAQLMDSPDLAQLYFRLAQPLS